MIEKNLYASCRVDENEDLIEIKEKFSFEKDKPKQGIRLEHTISKMEPF